MRMPSYVVFGVFLRAAHVIKGETQLSKIKAVFCPSHLRKKKKEKEKRKIWKTELRAQKSRGKFKGK